MFRVVDSVLAADLPSDHFRPNWLRERSDWVSSSIDRWSDQVDRRRPRPIAASVATCRIDNYPTRRSTHSLREAVDTTGLFIDRGPVVQVKDSFGQIRALNDTVSGMAWDGPLVVMTSKFSASASEILAGAIQDYKRGIVVGDSSTHGKGTVQNLIDLNQEIFQVAEPTDRIFGAFKVTMQQFYRPQGDSTQKRGVLADLVMPSITDHMDVSESDLDHAMDFDKVPSARFSPLNLVNNEALEKLRQRSEERRQASEDFVKRQRDIGLYIDQKDKKTLSLSEEKFFARRKELNADKEDEKMMEKQANPGEITRDFFMEEILSITVDYMEALASSGVAAK